VIDEAHHFRNRGRKPDADDESTWSRYHPPEPGHQRREAP